MKKIRALVKLKGKYEPKTRIPIPPPIWKDWQEIGFIFTHLGPDCVAFPLDQCLEIPPHICYGGWNYDKLHSQHNTKLNKNIHRYGNMPHFNRFSLHSHRVKNSKLITPKDDLYRFLNNPWAH